MYIVLWMYIAFNNVKLSLDIGPVNMKGILWLSKGLIKENNAISNLPYQIVRFYDKFK